MYTPWEFLVHVTPLSPTHGINSLYTIIISLCTLITPEHLFLLWGHFWNGSTTHIYSKKLTHYR